MKKILFVLPLLAVLIFGGYSVKKQEALGATALFPSGGGTGTSSIPTYGMLLVGNSGGTYSLRATSTLGITAAFSTSDADAWYAGKSVWGTTSEAFYWTTKTTDNLAEGSTNLYSPWAEAGTGLSYTTGNVTMATSVQQKIKAASSAGFLILSSANSDVALFGPGGGQSVTFYNGGTFVGDLAIGNASHGEARLEVKASTNDGSTDIFHGDNSDNTEVFTIQSNGYVGILDSSPSYQLDVNGTINTTNLITVTSTTTGITYATQICFPSGECMTSPTTQGTNITMYPHNAAAEIVGYERFRTSPDTGGTNTDESCSADADITSGYCDIDPYVSTTTDLAISSIPAGIWSFHFFTYVNSATGISNILADMYRRSSSGVETLLFTATSSEINNTTVAENQFTTTQGAFTFTTTDRLVMKVRGWTNQGTAKVIHFQYGGTSPFYSHVETPINIGNFNYARKDLYENITGGWTFIAGTSQVVSSSTTSSASSSAITLSAQDGMGGSISFANDTARIGISRDGTLYGYDYDGALVFRQSGSNPDSDAEFIFMEQSGAWRFVMPKSGADKGTYNPRSMIIAGPSTNQASALTCSYWGFSNIDCNTSGTGADLGVQDDLQVLGTGWFGTASTSNLTVTSNSQLGTITSGTWNGTVIGVQYGGTGLSTFTGGGRLLYSLNPGTLTTLATSTYGSVLQIDSNGYPSWVATSSLNIDLSNTTGNIKTYPAFSYATTTWSGTTTIPLGTAYVAETWNGAQCFTDVGTVNVSFSDGTNRMTLLNASTTVGTVLFGTNNTFTVGEKRYVDIGTPASSPRQISCTINKSLSPR